jgi:Tripartite tricarboxylate transporter family receptor
LAGWAPARSLKFAFSGLSADLPDIPTIAEAYPGVAIPITWFGLLAPAGTPKPVIEKLNNALAAALRYPDAIAKLKQQGQVAVVEGPGAFARRVQEEIAIYDRLIPSIGIQPEWEWICQIELTILCCWRGIIMKPSIIAVMLLASTTLSSLAQELSAEDRACITSAVAKLPQVAALNIEGSRAIEGRVLEQPQSQGRRKWNVYRVRVEIDVSVAGQRSTYVFSWLGMRWEQTWAERGAPISPTNTNPHIE